VSRRCSECGRQLDFLLSIDETIDPLERIASSPWLIAACAWVLLLIAVGLEAILR